MDSPVLASLSYRKQAQLLGCSAFKARYLPLGLHTEPVGRLTKFNAEEENHLEDLLLSCSRIGVPLSIWLFNTVVDSVAREKGTFGERQMKYLR